MQEWLRQRILQKLAADTSGEDEYTPKDSGDLSDQYLAARKGKVPVDPPKKPGDEGSAPTYPVEEIKKESALRRRAIDLIKEALQMPPAAGPEAEGEAAPPPPPAPREAAPPPPPAPAPQMAPPAPEAPAAPAMEDPRMAAMKMKLQQHLQEHTMMEQMGMYTPEEAQEEAHGGSEEYEEEEEGSEGEQPGMGMPEAEEEDEAEEEGAVKEAALRILKDLIYEGF